MDAEDVFSLFPGEEVGQEFFKEALCIAPEVVITNAGLREGAVGVKERRVGIFLIPPAFRPEDDPEGDKGLGVYLLYFLEDGKGVLKSLLDLLRVHREVHEETVPVDSCLGCLFDLLQERFHSCFICGVPEKQERRDDLVVIDDGASI
jgi:hypothetical protein